MRSCCPLCFCPAERRHSHYTRMVADLPCAGFRIQLTLHVRRFFCDNADCTRKITTRTASHLRSAVGTSHRPSLRGFSIAWFSDQWRVGNSTRGASGNSNVANNDPSSSHGASNCSRRTGSRAWNRWLCFSSPEKIWYDPGRHATPQGD